jgi:hypothetical protein
LAQKRNQKKVKAAPASHEKRASDGFPSTRDKLACGSNRKDFLTPSSLVFRLTGQGRSIPRRILFILGKIPDIHKNKKAGQSLVLPKQSTGQAITKKLLPK